MESSRIEARPDVAVATTAPRVTPTPPRGAFKKVLTQSLVRGAEAAMKVLPGSPLMAVAIRGAQGSGPAIGVPLSGPGSPIRSGGASPEGPAPIGASGNLGAAASATGAGIGGASAEAGGVESSIQQSQEMNLYYLQIQEAVNAQNRSFTALSNVLKAEHDTVKTAIGNIR